MFSNFSSMFSLLTGNTSSNESSSETKVVKSTLSVDSAPFAPGTLGLTSSSVDIDGDLYFDLDDETDNVDGDNDCEYVPQSACVSAEIQSEMDEVLIEILRAHCGSMNYAAATKTMTSTISVRSQRLPMARRYRERSRDEVITDGVEGSFGNEGDALCPSDDGFANDDADGFDYGDARAAAKSFGTTKVSNYYRTKPLHDAARQQRMQAVAKRSSRHPNDRNVASQAHRLAPGQKRSAMRGGHSAGGEVFQ